MEHTEVETAPKKVQRGGEMVLVMREPRETRVKHPAKMGAKDLS